MTARQIAALVLVRVEKDAAFAAAALEAELARAPQLPSRDRALATELVYGSLRVRGWLEAQLERCASHGMSGVDLRTRVELELATYQLFFLSRVPAFAAVNEAVDRVRQTRGTKIARFANAVLRRLSAESERMSELERGSLAQRAVWESSPPWLRDALARALGEEGAKAFLRPGETPPTGIRVENVSERDVWRERFTKVAPQATFDPGVASPLAILARGAGRIRKLPGFEEGAWSIQEEGSQVVALAVGAKPNDRVLDACAGRGNKAAILARAVQGQRTIDVADTHPDKLARLTEEFERLGLRWGSALAVDWSVGAGDCKALYDRVLVDAPCSGTGTVRRRPELLSRRKSDDFESLSLLQRKILLRVSERVAPGGRLVYAVCSVLREEAEAVVEGALAEAPSLELAPFDSALAAKLAGANECTLRLLPYVHGTDGYFLASFRKKE
jgi:16S rRNA (cytosine967-C5)-methyltransferase